MPGRLSHRKQQVGACRTGLRGCLVGGNPSYDPQPSAPWQFGVVMWRFTFSSDLARQKDTTGHRHFSARRAVAKSRRGCGGGQSLQGAIIAPPSGSPCPHLADAGARGRMWRILLPCWMRMWGSEWEGLGRAEVFMQKLLISFSQNVPGVYLHWVASILVLDSKIKTLKKKKRIPDGDSAALDVKISSPLWVRAHLYTWFMPAGMREGQT